MSYPGNPSLSADAQQRILGTFQQTLDLAAQGSRQEALLGCDFVLRMDPGFEPARQLLDRLKSASGAVRVDDLRDGAGQPGSDLPSGFDSLGSLDALDSLEPLEDLSLEDELTVNFASLPGNGGDPSNLRGKLQELFAARRLQDFLSLAQANQAAVAADPELRTLAQSAQERLEAEPYVARFLGKAREALQAGQRDEVGRLLDKARSLDPSHPGIAEVERLAASAVSATPAAAAARAPQEIPAALRPNAMPPVDLFGEGGGDSESERRIAQLLAEGQSAFDAGDPQAAIDAWSRIFLIDIDHQEAARRIEQARKLKAENERQVEEIFHDGLNNLEAGHLPAARRAFEQVLTLQPSYLAAREYLQQIDAGVTPVLAPRAGGREPMSSMPAGGPGSAAGDTGSALNLPNLPEPGDLKEEILVPPEPGEAPRGERREPRRAAVRESRAGRRFLYIGGAVLALVLAAGAFLYFNWERYFPNQPADHLAPPASAPTASTSPVTRAITLHNQGKAANALALLRRVPAGDPQYAEAQKLIAQWESAAPGIAATGTEPAISGGGGGVGGVGAPGAPAASAAAALPTEAAAHRQELIEAGRKAFAQGDYVHASTQFEQAATLAKLDPPEADQLAQANRRLQPVAEQVKLFRQHDWEYILPTLWKMRESNPDDHNINRLIVDSYYNLGIRDLQRADPVHAAAQFGEALKIEPGDPVLRRHYLFAQTYQERPQDLLFRIYIKYLPYR
jgi:tetratricopeptide (TPR) repeat protein